MPLLSTKLLTVEFKFERKLINENDVTYSPLALYFIIDNNLIDNNNEINILFDVLIKKTNLSEEIKNLINLSLFVTDMQEMVICTLTL